MSSEKVSLYHSTDDAGLKQILNSGRLFGSQELEPKKGYSDGANLTTDPEASQAFIRHYRGSGQWTENEGPPQLVMLTFIIPVELIVNTGITHIFECQEYATNLTVDAKDIPDSYFENRHAGRFPWSKEQAIREQASGKVRFYEVPLDFLEDTEVVIYKYKDVTYPKKQSSS